MGVKVAEGILAGMNGIFQLAAAGFAIGDSVSLLRKEKLSGNEKAQVVANLVFAGTQIGDIGLSLAHRFGREAVDDRICLASKAATGSLDVARRVIRGDDWSQIVATTMFRIADVGGFLVQTRAHLFKGFIEEVKIGFMVLDGSSLLLYNKQTLQTAAGRIKRFLTREGPPPAYLQVSSPDENTPFSQCESKLIVTPDFNAWLRGYADAWSELSCPLMPSRLVLNPVVCLDDPTLFVDVESLERRREKARAGTGLAYFSWKGKEIPFDRFSEKYDLEERIRRLGIFREWVHRYMAEEEETIRKLVSEEEFLSLSLIHWEHLKKIPLAIAGRGLLVGYACLIGQYPIRFAYSPIGGKESEKILYERETILDWIEKNRDKAPPGWPEVRLKLPLRVEYVKPNNKIQAVIDQQLKAVAKEEAKKRIIQLKA